MHPIYLLFQHRLTRWLRDSSWGAGTVAGQAVMLTLLLFLLLPIASGSYALGSLLRELYPGADPLRLINGGMLYLLPVLTVGRFLLQAPPPERLDTYLALPINQQDLMRGQVLLPFMSIHTVLALVVVVPLWTAEVWPALAPSEALAWLGSVSLLTVVLPCLGGQGMQLLIGQRPKWFSETVTGLIGLFAADALLGPDLIRSASRLMFGTPLVGLLVFLGASGGAYAGLLHLMQNRLEIDRFVGLRKKEPPRWSRAFYRWIEQVVPAGRLVAVELRQAARTRRLRGVLTHTLIATILIHGWGIVSVTLSPEGVGSSYYLITLAAGIGGPTLGVGTLVFSISHGYVGALFTQPHCSTKIVWCKITLLWLSTIPGTLLLTGVCIWLPASTAVFLLSAVLWWWGLVVPVSVWMGIYFRKPVDLSASHLSIKTDFYTLPTLLLAFLPMVGFVLAESTGSWWEVSGGMSVVGFAGLCLFAWKTTLVGEHLEHHRHEMFEGFRTNELI
jgi:hypothetical protein